MLTVLQVALGGAFGAVLRYMIILQSGRLLGTGFPHGTMAVNLVGSFLMGVAFAWATARGATSPLLMAGFLGGFTTFSAFSLDAIGLMERGEIGAASIYVIGSVLGAILLLFLGLGIGRGIFS